MSQNLCNKQTHTKAIIKPSIIKDTDRQTVSLKAKNINSFKIDPFSLTFMLTSGLFPVPAAIDRLFSRESCSVHLQIVHLCCM